MHLKKTNYIILALVAILALLAGFLLVRQIGNENYNYSQFKEPSKIKTPENTNTLSIGQMKLLVPKDYEVTTDDFLTTIKVPGVYKSVPNAENSLDILIYYRKEFNVENLSLADWFDENDPTNSKTSASYDYAEEKEVDGLKFLETRYIAPTSFMVSRYYDVVSRYFANNQDIYNIVVFQKSQNNKIVLNSEEEVSIKNYEKTVDQIIKSIKFVD